jgi:hypothetical protein
VERRLHRHGLHMRKSMQPWIFAAALLLFAGRMARSQIVSFGVKAGVPLTTVYTPQQIPDGGSNASEQRFTIGPTAEVHLPFTCPWKWMLCGDRVPSAPSAPTSMQS